MSTAPDTAAIPNWRKRRLPYTNSACDHCKRRKVKCSGERPCKGCRNSNALCIYERSTRYRSNSRSSLAKNRRGSTAAAEQDQEIRASRITASIADQTKDASTTSALHCTPGSSDYYLRLAEKRLSALSPENDDPAQESWAATPVGAKSVRQLIDHRKAGSPGGALAALELGCWMAVLRIYEEEVGLQYPFIDLEDMSREIKATTGSTPSNHAHDAHSITNKDNHAERLEEVMVLILVVASTLVDPATINIAKQLVEDISVGAIARTHLNSVDKDELTLLILTSIFFFLSDREIQAWRIIGTVLRLLQELICQSSEELQCPASLDHLKGIGEKLYWSAYTLDRRWSFGTGLPFATQDSNIVQQPNFEDDSISSAYLRHMITYCGISSEVRTCILQSTLSQASTSASTRDFLDFRVVQWQRNLPLKLQFRGVEDKFDAAKEKRGEYRLRLILYLRANQMRTVIHRKSALSSRPGSFDSSSGTVLTEIAQDTVQVLVAVARETTLYHAQHKTFNHFLETALTSLLLILCHSGAPQNATYLKDVLAAMDVVKHLSAHSPITRALENKLRGIQGVVNNLRLDSPVDSRLSNCPERSNSISGKRSAYREDGYTTHDATQTSNDACGQISQEQSGTERYNPSQDPPLPQRGMPKSPLQPPIVDAQTEGLAGGSHGTYWLSEPSVRPMGPPDLSFPVNSTQDPLYAPTFSTMSDSSSQVDPSATLQTDPDSSRTMAYLPSDFFEMSFTDLGDILKEYETFTF